MPPARLELATFGLKVRCSNQLSYGGNRRLVSVRMRISAKVDYAVRATLELAQAGDDPVKGDVVAEAQDIPLKFLENILGELKHSGIVASRRGAQGGYWLAKEPDEVTLADIVRAVEGPLATVRGEGPEALDYKGAAKPLRELGSLCAQTSARCWTR